jgi:hypothetical protein
MSDFVAALRSLFETVGEFESSLELRGSLYVAPWITVSHVLSMCLFAGTILMMDLRLLGIGNMNTPFSQVQRRLFPWQLAGIALSTITGLALVYANPMNFFANIIFWTKMIGMVIAALNAVAFHFITEYSLVDWDSNVTPPFGAKLAGGLSILLWVNVILAGRLIPYANTWFAQY